MSAIAALLERAKAEVAEQTATPSPVDPWPLGAFVERTILDPLQGRVAFVEDGWVYWAAEDGHVHASRPDVLRRIEQ